MTTRERVRDEEAGRITLMAIGMVVAVLMVGYAVIAASAIHLERKGLQSLAESLAVRAASAVNVQGYLERGPGGPFLSEHAAREAIDEHLSRLGGATPDSFTLIDVTVGQDQVSVTTSAIASPPFLPEMLWPVTLQSRASAQLYDSPRP